MAEREERAARIRVAREEAAQRRAERIAAMQRPTASQTKAA